MDLMRFIHDELSERRGEWAKIAKAVPVSYSWLRAVGSGTYRSRPLHSRVLEVSDYLRKTRRPKVP